MIISVHYLFPNHYYYPFLVFLVSYISTTLNKWTTTRSTQPVGLHWDSNGTSLCPDTDTTLVNTATAYPAYTQNLFLEQWITRTGMPHPKKNTKSDSSEWWFIIIIQIMCSQNKNSSWLLDSS